MTPDELDKYLDTICEKAGIARPESVPMPATGMGDMLRVLLAATERLAERVAALEDKGKQR